MSHGVLQPADFTWEPDLEARMRRAAGDVPVAFAFGPEYRYELLAAP